MNVQELLGFIVVFVLISDVRCCHQMMLSTLNSIKEKRRERAVNAANGRLRKHAILPPGTA